MKLQNSIHHPADKIKNWERCHPEVKARRISDKYASETSLEIFLRFRRIRMALCVTFVFMLCALIWSKPVHAQAIDPTSWQTGATGLRTSANPNTKTAGLTVAIKVSGIPFLSLQGGITDAGWSKLAGPPKGVDLGEIKIPGTYPSLSTESADWAHNEMTFTNDLKIWISRLSPSVLIQNQNASLRLFSGNLAGGAAIVPGSQAGQPWLPLAVLNRTPAPAYPKYVAYSSGGTIRIQAIPASGSTVLSLPTLDNNWVMVWYGDNSYFVETNKPFFYYDSNNVGILPHPDAYQADAPILLKFQNNPTSIRQSSEGGIDLNFSVDSGYSLLMPILGRAHPKSSDTESWGTSSNLPANIISKINFWVSGSRLCSYPTQVSESYAYDNSSDTSTITENISYLNVCAGGSTNSGFAILPPTLALAKDALKVNIQGGSIVDTSYSTEFGPIMGIDNTCVYSWSVTGMKKYTDSKRVLINTGAAPTEVVQKLTQEIDKTITDGHYKPWLYSQHMPVNGDVGGYIYFLNPGDIIYQLSEIAQALPDSANPQNPKNRLIEYIKSERTNPNYHPETVYNLPNEGTQRTSHAIRNSDPSSLDGYRGLNYFQSWQNRNPHLFLKRVPLYNFYALAKYYELPGTGSVSASTVTAAKTALNNEMKEQDWATFSWFQGFNKGIQSGHSTLIDVNRLLDGLIGFVKLTKAANDTDENIGRTLLTKVAMQRVAMAQYPRYLYNFGLQTLPSDPDWMPKYAAGNWQGWIWNYNWRGPYDDLRQIAIQDHFGTAIADSTSYYPPIPHQEIRDYEYLQLAFLNAYKDMVPETFRLVTDFAKQDFEIYLNRVTNLLPHWYMPYIEDVVGGEHGTTYPINSYQLFMAKAFVTKDTADNLRKYASFSWMDSGDFFYMHKLAEAIKTYQGWKWEDEVSGSGTPGDINNDTQVNILDIQACVNHILGIQDLGSRADVNGDGSVDVLDVQNIVNIILGV